LEEASINVDPLVEQKSTFGQPSDDEQHVPFSPVTSGQKVKF
jgi:hypothetical protein